jgi:sulfatase maturation enzyme AslB (radical SAM superfamily)
MCCVGDGAQNKLRDASGRQLHINHGLTDAEVLNSPDMKAIRRSMLRAEWPSACERCRRDEETGAPSHRHYMGQRFGHFLPAALDDTAEDGTLGHPSVRYADIRLGNVCNLTCRMCGPEASRLWADLHNTVRPPSEIIPVATLTALRDDNWVKSSSLAWLIQQCLPSVDSLHFAGGEPLIIPEMVEALEMCIRAGRAHEINLSYNTNLTVLPDKVTRLWPEFKSVIITYSVDGYGPLNDYIRRPSKWADIDANLRRLDRNFARWKLRAVVCNTTVQIYNVLQLGDFYEYLASGFENIEPVPRLSPLHTPSYLSIQALSPRVKDVARQKLLLLRSQTEAWLSLKRRPLAKYLDSVITFMDAAQISNQLANFLYFSEKSDRQFNDSWRRACPELASALAWKGPSMEAATPAGHAR